MQSDSSIKMENLRISTRIEKEAAETLRAHKIPPVVPIMEPKTRSTTAGNVPLTTNVYGVMAKGNIPIYRYDVDVIGYVDTATGRKQVSLTKKMRGDAFMVDRLDKCREVFLQFKKIHEGGLLKDVKCIYYDLASILFSLNILDIKKDSQTPFPVPIENLKNFEGFAAVEILLRPVTEDFQVTLADYSGITSDLSKANNSLAQCLDILTSQHMMFDRDDHVTFNAHSSYLMDPMQYGFSPGDVTTFKDNGSYLAIGAQKNIRFVEGPNQKCYPALVVQTKKTPFHNVELLTEKIARFANITNLRNGDHDKIRKMCKGLVVETSHLGRHQRFIIRNMCDEGARTKRFDADGTQITVQDYFKQRHKIDLKYPDMMLVEARGKDGGKSFFPAELCKVVDNQRLKTNQMTSRVTQDMIKKCAIAPSDLKDHISKTFNSLHLNQDNLYMANAQLSMTAPLSLTAQQLPPPEIEFGNNSIVRVRNDNFTWQGRNFLIPRGCNKFAAFAFLGQRDNLSVADYKNFIGMMVRDANTRGMRYPNAPFAEPTLMSSSNYVRIEEVFKEAVQKGCDFILVVHGDTDDDMHAQIKLLERRYSVCTQCFRVGTVNNVVQRNQHLTVANCINKSNVKMGGLNFTLSQQSVSRELFGTDTLIIGFGMNHPGGGLGFSGDDSSGTSFIAKADNIVEPPSIVGYAANIGVNHEFEYVGDFICQEPRREEKIDIISTIVGRCVKKFSQYRKKMPKRVLLLRNDCSEGAFKQVLMYEVPLAKKALKDTGCDAKVTLVVPNKLQAIRFFNAQIDSRAKASDQNIKPGIMVDHSVTHPKFAEFFLNSHRALQGTARTPKYTILIDENKLGVDKLSKMIYDLCYGHQIVYSPTSLPSPVYIANRYAERGRKLYMRWIAEDRQARQTIGYAEMTKELSYVDNKELEFRRINA